MQRYRVNYILLASLVGGFLVFSGASYAFWNYQVNRNATDLLDLADRYEEEGKQADALKNLDQYLRLRRDDDEVRIRMANLAQEISAQDQASIDDYRKAYAVLEDALRRTDDPGIRRKFADIQLKFGRPIDALKTLEPLIELEPNNTELQALKTLCLFQAKKFKPMLKQGYAMIGYNPISEEFDLEKATAPGELETYDLLSRYLSTIGENEELNSRIIEQMVIANPDTFKSHLMNYKVVSRRLQNEKARTERETTTYEQAVVKSPTPSRKEAARKELEAKEAEFKAQLEEIEAEAEASLAKAYELGPEEEQVLLAMGNEERTEERFDEALKFYREGAEKFPENAAFPLAISQTQLANEDPEAARATLAAAVKEFGVERGYPLAKSYMELLLQDKDEQAIDRQISAFEKGKHPIFEEVADFYRARQAQMNRDFKKAIQIYRRVRPKLTGDRGLQLQAGVYQAACHAALEEGDLALDIYRSLAQTFPGNALVEKQLKAIERSQGSEGSDSPERELQRMIDVQLAREESEQDWNPIQLYIDGLVDRKLTTEARKHLYEAQVAVARGLWDEAQDRIREGYAKDSEDINIHYSVARLLNVMPNKGPAVAMKSLDKTVKKFGDSAYSRIMLADLLASLYRKTGDEEVADQIRTVAEDMGDWTIDQKANVWNAVGSQYRRLKKYDEAWQATLQATKLTPNSVKLYDALFDIGYQERNDARMEEAQELLLKYLGDKNDPAYLALGAKRILIGVTSGALAREELTKAEAMVDRALKARPSWSELNILKGQLALQGASSSQDLSLAVESFRQAIKNSRATPNVVAILVQLLARQGNYAEAYQQMQAIPHSVRSQYLGQVEADVLSNNGDSAGAYKSAETLAKAAPDNGNVQAWFAEIARNADKLDDALEAANRTVEILPDSFGAWTTLVNVLISRKEFDEVESTLRKAQLALDASYIPTLTAYYYKRSGKWQRAENIYLTIWGEEDSDGSNARRMADFYLTWNLNVPKETELIEKAKPYINRILKDANEGKYSFDTDNARWALRKAATMMARTGDYRDSLKAERLLTTAYEKSANKERMAGLLADIFSVRRDPASWLKAVEIFSDLKQTSKLTKAGDVRLGQLLYQVGEWEACQDHMEDLIGRYPEDVKLRVRYLGMLIEQREFEKADQWLTGIQEFDETGELTLELRAQLASARGDMEQARQILQRVTPDVRKLTKATLPKLLTVAGFAQRVEDYEYAESLYENYLRFDKNPQVFMQLAALRANHLNAEQGLQELQQFFSKNIDSVLQQAVAVYRSRRAEYGDRLDETINKMVKAALRDDPESARRLLAEAEMLEIQENYDGAIAAYEAILDRDDIPETLRASGMNNLAFLYALTGREQDKALRLVNDTIELIGPLSDVLDTRGLIHVARGEGLDAAKDMRMAIRIGATPSKYFHLAQAELLAGNEEAALEAWDRGEKIGLEASVLTPLEQEGFKQAERKIESIRAKGAEL
ncbi:tetratricopeptide repeat protein [Adhaeretor mobilis]|uniref:Tetratricopeptide repeat protein n=1 Tax=Adhaeretor mobilis TaxID=1930276 RepID=A0A517MQ27_9BACT|nr:tetratricopeptide repeat protein [Adhaeretor mobilis]QDS96990.1 tetratricopeptide repeat protein [Adhaeretor mobilis]